MGESVRAGRGPVFFFFTAMETVINSDGPKFLAMRLRNSSCAGLPWQTRSRRCYTRTGVAYCPGYVAPDTRVNPGSSHWRP